MSIDRSTVERVARLSRLELTESEKNEMTTQMANIIHFIEKINLLDTSGVNPLPRDESIANVEREDVPHKQPIARDELLALAPSALDGCIVVPRIIE